MSQQPQKDLILASQSYPYQTGMVNWMDQLARALAEEGHSVEHIASFEESVAGWDGPYALSSLNGIGHPLNWGGHYLKGGHRLLRLRNLLKKRLADDYCPDVILTDSTPGLMLIAQHIRRQKNGKHVVLVGGDFFKESSHRLLRGLVAWLYRRADMIIVDGSDLQRLLIGIGVAENRIRILPHGVDPFLLRPGVSVEPFQNFLRERELAAPIPGSVIISHGALKESTGCEDLFRLAREVRPSAVILVGDGPLRYRLEARAVEMDIPVLLTGFLPSEVLPSALASADLGVYPFRQMAGVSLAVVEAMSCGLPVIATDCGDLRGIVIDGETGFLTPRGNIEALISAAKRILQDAELRRSIGIAARKEIERGWSLESRQREFLSAMKELLKPL